PAKPLPSVGSTPPAPNDTEVGGFGWFWDTVPVNGLGAGGVDKALAVLRNSPSGAQGPVYRLASLKALADRYGPTLLAESVGTSVSPALALAVIAVESAGRVSAISGAGAEGLMQLMPATAARFDVADSLDPQQNIRGGISYLDWLMTRFHGDPILALAGYNAGEGAVERHGGVPPFAETRDYVPKVLAAFAVARGLCATPPVLVSDGCVFVGERMASSD
ncbi:lytic transglycosylase domain-containing protein, partial [Palleronia sp.]|uniref:lytic transglycosylase domain-containing protein n=1 Tax=Palleronia sp. TaxID=1940284 RepID=UPI0035C829AA